MDRATPPLPDRQPSTLHDEPSVLSRRGPQRVQCRVVVRFLGDFRHDLDVSDLILRIDHEQRPRQQPQVLDEHAIGASERRFRDDPRVWMFVIFSVPQNRFCANGRSVLMT